MATQNPIELEGTFPLPEAQLDRFGLKIRIGYPSQQEEAEILERFQRDDPYDELEAVATPDQIRSAINQRRNVIVSAPVRDYISSLAHATRKHEALRYGASPRGSITLMRAAQALAFLRGRDFVLPDDVKHLAAPVLGRRYALLDALLSFTLAAAIAVGSKNRRLFNYKMAALLLIQLVLVTRGGVTVAAPPDMFFLYSFLLCGLTAIGLAGHHGAADKEFLPGIRGIAALLIIVTGMLMAAGLVATAAATVLAPVAEDGYEAVKTVARPLGSMITRFLIFVFRRDLDYKAGMGGLEVNPGDLHPKGTGPSDVWLARLMSEGLIGLLFIGSLVIAGVALWQLIRWMLRREAPSVESPKQANRLFGLLFRFWAWLRFRWDAFVIRLGGPVPIGQLFISLQAWGRFGGVSRRRWETPGEYAVRLCARFPQTAEDINTIVTAYQQRFYGEHALDKDGLTASDAAWRRLKSPKLWTLRWQALLGRPRTP